MKPPASNSEIKAARSLAEVSPAFRRKLNRGEIESRSLAEWLSVDLSALVRHVFSEMELDPPDKRLLAILKSRAEQGMLKCLDAIGSELVNRYPSKKERSALRRRFQTYPCDLVREFSCRMLKFEKDWDWSDFLKELKPLASDTNMSVREGAWMALRPRVIEDTRGAFRMLQEWTIDQNPNVRRCAVEATRPRGVWCAHVIILKENPEPGKKLLMSVKRDSSDYVLRSASNWINDASKSRPDWVLKLASEWREKTPHPRTEKLLRHALRTLRKKDKQ